MISKPTLTAVLFTIFSLAGDFCSVLAADPSHTLHGGVKDQATINSSVELVPGAARNGASTNQPHTGNVTQFSGGVQTGGPTNPVLNGHTNHFNLSATGVGALPGYNVTEVHTPPESAFSRVQTPGRGYIQYVPGYEVHLGGQTAVGAPYPAQSSGHGITTYVPGYDTSHVKTTTSTSTAYGSTGTVIWGSGTQPVAPLKSYWDGSTTVTKHEGVSSFTPGTAIRSELSQSEQHAAPIAQHEGVSVYVPGYEISHAVPPTSTLNQFVNPGLRGVLVSHAMAEAMATPGILGIRPGGESVSAIDGGMPTGLSAVPGLLPGLKQAKVLRSTSWKDWYDRFAKTVYGMWSQVDVGPGAATVRVIASRAGYLDCEVVNFEPAPDVDRDGVRESLFRETGVKDIYSLTRSEIVQFPLMAAQQSVTFDVILKRAVDGPSGCQVIAAHTH